MDDYLELYAPDLLGQGFSKLRLPRRCKRCGGLRKVLQVGTPESSGLIQACLCIHDIFDLWTQAEVYKKTAKQYGVNCTKCHVHCPHAEADDDGKYTCWSCRTYPFFQSRLYADD